MKIVILISYPALREDLRDLLALEGYDVHIVENKAKQVNQLFGSRPDIIICDNDDLENIKCHDDLQTKFHQTSHNFVSTIYITSCSAANSSNHISHNVLSLQKPFPYDQLLTAIQTLQRYIK